MANLKISELTAVASVGASDILPVVQAGVTKNASVANLVAASVLTGALSGAETAKAPTHSAVSNAIAALSYSTGSGQLRAYKTGAVSYVAISTTDGVSSTIAMPANSFGPNAYGLIFLWGEQNGTTNSATVTAHIGAAGFTPGATNRVTGGITMSTTSNRVRSFTWIRGNETDRSSVIGIAASAADPTGAVASSTQVTRTVDMTAAFEIKFTCTTGGTDQARCYGLVVVIDPDVAADAAVVANATTRAAIATDLIRPFLNWASAVTLTLNGGIASVGDTIIIRHGGSQPAITAGTNVTFRNAVPTMAEGQRVNLQMYAKVGAAESWEFVA